MSRSTLAGYSFFTVAGLVITTAIWLAPPAAASRAIRPINNPQAETTAPGQLTQKKTSANKQKPGSVRARSRRVLRGVLA